MVKSLRCSLDRCTQHTDRCTQHTHQCTQHTGRCTQHTDRCTQHTDRCTQHTVFTDPDPRIRTPGLRIWIPVLLCSFMAFKIPKKVFSPSLFAYYLPYSTFTSVFKHNKLLKSYKIVKSFSSFFTFKGTVA
jgi:hypothetical protein